MTAIWLVALVTAEVVALIVGILGCVTGSIALWKAIHALNKITELELEQGQTIGEISEKTEAVEASMKQLLPDRDNPEDNPEESR